MGQKQDAVPGITTTLVITPDEAGRLPARLHRALRARALDDARAGACREPPQSSTSWVREQQQGGGGGGPTDGAALFTSQGCGSCHAFKPAGTTAEVGPSTSTICRPTRSAPASRSSEYVHDSIVDPERVRGPGLQQRRHACVRRPHRRAARRARAVSDRRRAEEAQGRNGEHARARSGSRRPHGRRPPRERLALAVRAGLAARRVDGALFFGIGLGLVVFFRWLGELRPDLRLGADHPASAG